MYSQPYPHEEPMEEAEDASLVRTCHLCGKAQCGQRKGRVRCAYCKRIFCLQQLYKKFKIKASVDDKNFKCPRCTGICCCVCNCQRPPPHVHCKVYKVRQNKKRVLPSGSQIPNPPPPQDVNPFMQQHHLEPTIAPSLVPYVVPSMESVIATQQDSELPAIADSSATPFSSFTPEIPGSSFCFFVLHSST